jgi:hypothetical protein
VRRTVSEQIQKDFFSVFEQMGRYHPSEPHWYLPLTGVDPLQQGKGIMGRDRELIKPLIRLFKAYGDHDSLETIDTALLCQGTEPRDC